jgi:hypothetical protein
MPLEMTEMLMSSFSSLSVTSSGSANNEGIYAVFIIITSPVFSDLSSSGSDYTPSIPDEIAGQS